MDHEVAEWLADLIQQTTDVLDHRPGLTIEVDDDPTNWVQVIPASDHAANQLSGFIVNFPFKSAADDPLEYLQSAGICVPHDTDIASWEQGSHITLGTRPDIPLIELALLIGELLRKVGNAPDDFEINVQVLHGL